MKWAVSHDWAEVLGAAGSNGKAAAYQKTIDTAISVHFKLITTTRRSTDPPWVNEAIRRRVRQRKGIFRREGRSAKWKRLKKVVERMVKTRREKYMDSQRDVLLKEDSERNFFKNIKSYKNKDKPVQFNVRQLFPGKTDAELANLLADYFNAVSSEFVPLEPEDIPQTTPRVIEDLRPYQVAGRIRAFRSRSRWWRGTFSPG